MLFDGYLRWLTPLLWMVFAASSLTMYFFATWGPIVLEQMGLSRTGAALSISANSLASAIGGIAVMRFTDRLGAASLAVMPAIAVPLLIMTGLVHMNVTLVMALTTAMYLLLGGNHYGVQSILGLYYPTAERARGGRLGVEHWQGGRRRRTLARRLAADLPSHSQFSVPGARSVPGSGVRRCVGNRRNRASRESARRLRSRAILPSLVRFQ